MTFADHFSTIATRYAAYRPRYPRALVDALVTRSSPGTAWDVGCGNGQLAVALAEQGGDRLAHVIATDPSQAQLDAAPPHPRVEYRRVPAESSGLADASIDLVVAAQAAHWFDWPRFVGETERVAKPGALVALVSYGIVIVDGEAGRVIESYYRNVVGKYWPPGREHVENGYADLAMPWTPVEAPAAIAMTALWTRDELIGYASTWSATVRLVEAEGVAPFEALRDQLSIAWPGDERRLVRWPLRLRLARR